MPNGIRQVGLFGVAGILVAALIIAGFVIGGTVLQSSRKGVLTIQIMAPARASDDFFKKRK